MPAQRVFASGGAFQAERGANRRGALLAQHLVPDKEKAPRCVDQRGAISVGVELLETKPWVSYR